MKNCDIYIKNAVNISKFSVLLDRFLKIQNVVIHFSSLKLLTVVLLYLFSLWNKTRFNNFFGNVIQKVETLIFFSSWKCLKDCVYMFENDTDLFSSKFAKTC